MADPFTQTVELLRPHTPQPCRQLVARGDWAIGFPPAYGRAMFGIIAEGTCWFDHPGAATTRLDRGDFILLCEAPPWRLHSGSPSADDDLCAALESTSEPVVTFGGSDGPLTRIIGGHFDFDPTNVALLGQLLPPMIIVRSGETQAWRLHGLLDLIGDEVRAEREGHDLVLSRLLELLLMESLRVCGVEVAATRAGMLAGLADPRLSAAVRAIHTSPGHAWRVESLAQHAGMSRSAFAASFRTRLGVAPAEYLLQWRMALAKNALRFTDESLARIALASGYGSAAAFNTAFRRVVGQSPGAYGARVRPHAVR